jgi:4-aminobutyrate aminotransferase/(S)-3-amino-2-methylpropionate transaminase
LSIKLQRKSELIPGPISKELHEDLCNLEAPNLSLNDEKLSIIWEKAEGTRIIDVDGNEYIDFASGLNVANVGHTNSQVVREAKKQLNEQLQGMGDFHANLRKIEFLKKITEVVPIANPRVILTVNGSDAVDAALKTATLYTGKSNFISFYGAYHGMGAKSLEVTARHHFRKPFTKEIPKTATFVPYPYCYRCPFSKEPESCSTECLSYVEQTIENTAAGSDDIAAVVIESYQGRGGVVPAPTKFLKGLRELCTRNGILLILDEILSGFGRTGEWFGFEHAGIEPDIITIGKGLSSGYPISACIGKDEIMNGAWSKFAGESIHTSTFQGNPVGCAIAMASIKYLEEHNLVHKSKINGDYFLEQLKTKIGNHPNVGDIRGSGMMIGVEFVSDTYTKQPNAELCWNVMRNALDRGMLFLNGGHQVNVLCLTPPLVMQREEIDYCITQLTSILEESLVVK